MSTDKAFQKLDEKEQEAKCNIIATAYSCLDQKQQPHDYKEYMDPRKAVIGTVVHIMDPLYTQQIERNPAETKEVKDALSPDHLLIPPLIEIVNSYLGGPISYPHSLSIMKNWVQANIHAPLPCELPQKQDSQQPNSSSGMGL